jgi:transposase InsO family protein
MGQKEVSVQSKLLAVFSSGLDLEVTAVCEQLGISRQTFYKYRRRWVAEGPAGLASRSRRPHRSPTQVSAEVEEAIVRLRKALPVDNGAKAITYHLARQRGLAGPVPSAATVHRVLVRRGMVTPQPEKRPKSAWRRFEWPRPNDAWQIDATQWALSDGREVWIMDVLDDHSRLLVAARVCEGPSARAAWDAFSHGVTDWGIPARVMSDNGLCFTGRFVGGEVDFERSLRSLGVAHICSSPGHPQSCGKLERSHRTTKRWLEHLDPADTTTELQTQTDHWRHRYNHERPHSALDGATPIERWQAQPPAQPGPPIDGPRRSAVRPVTANGKIVWSGHEIGLGTTYAGQNVLVIDADDDITIHGQTGLIRAFTLDRNRRYQPSGKPPGRPPRPHP